MSLCYTKKALSLICHTERSRSVNKYERAFLKFDLADYLTNFISSIKCDAPAYLSIINKV